MAVLKTNITTFFLVNINSFYSNQMLYSFVIWKHVAHIFSNWLSIIEVIPTWTSTPPDLKVAVKSN